MKLNNKGFTLVEVLAVVVILGLLASIAIPSVLSAINTGKSTSYKIMISNIVTGSQTLYEEIYYGGSTLYKYNDDGSKSSEKITIKTINNESVIEINLQTLVSNGFIDGNNSCSANDSSCKDESSKVLINPDTKEDIGDCLISITKNVDNSTGIVSYEVKKVGDVSKCPSDYKKEVK